MLRNLILSLTLVRDVLLGQQKFDVLFVDQLSISIPLLRFTGARIFFYCHYPDKLLSERRSWLKHIYRLPLDWLEEITTGQADKIVANSKFTAGVFRQSFRSIHVDPEVLYPALNLASYDTPVDTEDEFVVPLLCDTRRRILSINRFERKKAIDLAVRAFAQLKLKHDVRQLQLVLAGGYDLRVPENVEYHRELVLLAEGSGLTTATYFHPRLKQQGSKKAFKTDVDVLFVPSFTEKQRRYLLDSCVGLIYTPSNEHFGIVPLEAMYSRRPVIAMNNGGPKETVLHRQTGWLCEPDETSVADAMQELIKMKPDEWKQWGEMARHSVAQRFSIDSFGSQLDKLLCETLAQPPRTNFLLWTVLLLMIASVFFFQT
jgi:alpha-1,3/alpha-1,6-mannosyltransferase